MIGSNSWRRLNHSTDSSVTLAWARRFPLQDRHQDEPGEIAGRRRASATQASARARASTPGATSSTPAGCPSRFCRACAAVRRTRESGLIPDEPSIILVSAANRPVARSFQSTGAFSCCFQRNFFAVTFKRCVYTDFRVRPIVRHSGIGEAIAIPTVA